MTAHRKMLLVVAALVVANAGIYVGKSTAATALSKAQPVSIGFARGYKPPAIFAWGQTLVYKFNLKSHSSATEEVALEFQGFEMNGKKGAQVSAYRLHYRLRPGQSIKVQYNVIPPTPPDIYKLMEFDLVATAILDGKSAAAVIATSHHGQ
jgi:hypothetical protein